MPLPMLLVLVDRQIFAATAAEERLVHLAHVLEEPLDVAPLPAQLALLPHLPRFDSAGVVQLYVYLSTARQTRARRAGFQPRGFKRCSKRQVVPLIPVVLAILLLVHAVRWEAEESLSQESTTRRDCRGAASR